MRKRIRAMAEGRFDYKEMEIKVSEERIERMAKKGELVKGSFLLESLDDRRMKGLIYTTDRRMVCDDVQFHGRKARIQYEFNTVGMEEGDTNKGEIYIESNAGEIIVPYVVSVQHYAVESSIGKIRDLYHFANLAQKDFQEAYRLFCSRKFQNIRMNQEQRMLYEALTHINVCRENMEEFLIAIHKKQPVHFRLHASEESYECEGDSFKKTVEITKNTWGYFHINVRTDVDFIQIEKPVIGVEDFVGNHCVWEFVIDRRRLHPGRNFAVLTFTSAVWQETLKIEIGTESGDYSKEREEKKQLLTLYQLYIRVRTHTIRENAWVREAAKCADTLHGLVPDNAWYMLLQAHMYAMSQRMTEASWILNKFHPAVLREEHVEQYAYYQYVNAMIKKDDGFTAIMVKELKQLCEEHPDLFYLTYIRLLMDEEPDRNRLWKYRMLKEQFEYGCHSPLLYLETCMVMKQDMAVFSHLDEFEKQVLNFAAKHELIDRELAVKTAQLASYLKQYDRMVYIILEACYDKYPVTECVEAVCTMLIRANRRSTVYFPWFERGVQEGLKLTQLFEYYLYTIPAERREQLPKTLLLYFNFESTLDYKRKAYLYANVWHYREELGELFAQYEPRIRMFVREELLHRHINENLAYLYERLSTELLQDEEASAVLEEMVFVKKLICKNPDVRHVVVRHWELDKEEIFPVVDKVAWVHIYYPEALILLEDKEGRRHLDMSDYELKPMFADSDISRYNMRFARVRQGLLINRYHKRTGALTASVCSICEKLLDKPKLKKEFRQNIRRQLIEYYSDNRRYDEVRQYLEELEFDCLTMKERAGYIEIMITLGMYAEAYALIQKYGPEEINPKRLVRLFSYMIDGEQVDEELLELCYYVFGKGKYDERMLEYLTHYFYGPTWQMDRLWRAAKQFDVETYEIGERILIQMLFTGYILPDSGEVFEDYYKPGFKTDVVCAYLAFFAYYYVVHEQIIDERIFLWIEKELLRGEEISRDCLVALLKYYSGVPALPQRAEDMLKRVMKDLLEEGIVFPFFRELDSRLNSCFNLNEKTIVEHRAAPDRKVYIYYGLTGGDEPMVYIKEEMRRVYDSIYIKELVTFYGEKVQYYIVEADEKGENGHIVGSALLESQNGDGQGAPGRYQMLNEMAASLCLGDEKSLSELMKRYGQLEVLTTALFELEE